MMYDCDFNLPVVSFNLGLIDNNLSVSPRFNLLKFIVASRYFSFNFFFFFYV